MCEMNFMEKKKRTKASLYSVVDMNLILLRDIFFSLRERILIIIFCSFFYTFVIIPITLLSMIFYLGNICGNLFHPFLIQFDVNKFYYWVTRMSFIIEDRKSFELFFSNFLWRKHKSITCNGQGTENISMIQQW